MIYFPEAIRMLAHEVSGAAQSVLAQCNPDNAAAAVLLTEAYQKLVQVQQLIYSANGTALFYVPHKDTYLHPWMPPEPSQVATP